MRGKRRERGRGGICGEGGREPGGGRGGQIVVARCGAGVWLERGERWEPLLCPLRCANGIHRCCMGWFRRLHLSRSRVEVWFRMLALSVMFQALDQAHSLRWGYLVHVAGQLSDTLLKTCTLHGEKSRSTGLMKVHHRSRVCRE